MCTIFNFIRKVEFLKVYTFEVFKTRTLEHFDICKNKFCWKN